MSICLLLLFKKKGRRNSLSACHPFQVISSWDSFSHLHFSWGEESKKQTLNQAYDWSKVQFLLDQGASVGIGSDLGFAFLDGWLSSTQMQQKWCNALFFPLYEEAVSAVPSCTRTLAGAVCLGSTCCCLVGKNVSDGQFLNP